MQTPTPKQKLARALWVLFNNSVAVGMGHLHAAAANAATEASLAQAFIKDPNGVSLDYCLGRMMKTGIKVTDSGELLLSPATPNIEYQSWAAKFPTNSDAIKAIEASFETNPPIEFESIPPTTLQLTADNVRNILADCIELTPEADTIKVEGVIHTVTLCKAKLAKHREDIKTLLSQLPKTFFHDSGGGWSFLNACMTASNVQWGEHSDIECLLILGLATNFIKFNLPREMWSILPGNMPYFLVDLSATE